MIQITGIKGDVQYINPDLIEKMDIIPDTTINLINGHRYFVRESPEQIVDKIINFRSKCSEQLSVHTSQHINAN